MSLLAGETQLQLQLPHAGFWYCRVLLSGASKDYVKQLRLVVTK